MSEKLKFEQVQKDNRSSFRYGYFSEPYQMEKPLHFHPELEITHVIKGYGHRMVGDFLEPFHEGELVLLPSNLPHCWIYNPDSFAPGELREVTFIQFPVSILDEGISSFVEWESMAHRLLSLQQGVRVTGDAAKSIIRILKEMRQQDAEERLMSFLRIIRLLGDTKEMNPIGLQHNLINSITKNMQRMQSIYQYVTRHYKQKISLQDMADEVNMSCSA